ncbi:helix-turn-helix domain-containing protein [Lacticaseibacillus kribbianus]|uniref:helix-turn-helix domain-containing protein n=1 Tax=Lacticaseibacillus kribbianus TaxID=2926292 RepID=UPI001CD32E58|nr:helix-turn-helix transcriptional regulator [Lacticaseibacillus kribbianus]
MFGERLAAARRAKGWTQAQLAEKCCVSRQTISSWENGRSYPDLASLVTLGDTLAVSLDALLKGDAPIRAALAKRQRLAASARRVLWACYGVAIALMPLLIWELPAPFAMGWAAKCVAWVALFASMFALERTQTLLTALTGRPRFTRRPGQAVSYARPRWRRPPQ